MKSVLIYILCKTCYIICFYGHGYNILNSLVGPGYGHELLPPSASDVGDVEAQNEGQGYQIYESITVNHHFLEKSEKRKQML